jgi:hypothetical protein
MEEQEWVAGQMLECHRRDLPGARKSGMSMSYVSFGLKAARPQPLVRKREARTAMVVLPVVDPNRSSVLKNGAVPGHAVGNTREEFRQVERCICVMTDPEKKNLTIEIIHATHRAFGNVRRKREWIRGDSGRLRSGRRKGVEVIAPQNTGQPPEHVGNGSQAQRGWSGHRVEWFVVILRPGWHHQSAFGSEGITESPD